MAYIVEQCEYVTTFRNDNNVVVKEQCLLWAGHENGLYKQHKPCFLPLDVKLVDLQWEKPR